ncbi:MAG: hypothetical protein ACKPB4_05305 [Sphaerospermopsis kisseleviana]
MLISVHRSGGGTGRRARVRKLVLGVFRSLVALLIVATKPVK